MPTNRFRLYLPLLALAVTCSSTVVPLAHAQVMDPPKVLQFTGEMVKPGKTGAVHEKSESQFVQAVTAAKWPTTYIGLTSISGPASAIFLADYASFDALEKDTAAIGKNKALSAALDRATELDGGLLDSFDQTLLTYNEEQSYHPAIDVSQMRVLEVNIFHVKPGHRKQWSDLVKMVKAAYDKAALGDVNWSTYELAFGGEDGTFYIFTWHKSLAEVDHEFTEGKQFMDALGDGIKKFDGLLAESVSGTENQLFAVNAHMSYVPGEWTKADPSFWKPAPAARPAAAKKPMP